jgi:hypothetical protein
MDIATVKWLDANVAHDASGLRMKKLHMGRAFHQQLDALAEPKAVIGNVEQAIIRGGIGWKVYTLHLIFRIFREYAQVIPEVAAYLSSATSNKTPQSLHA